MPTPCNCRRLTFRLGLATVALGFLALLPGCAKSGSSPDTPALPPLGPVVPDEPGFATEEQGTEEADRPTFNEFSWRDFVAVNWPAADDRRGEPHPAKRLGDPADRVVWESWKSLDELAAVDPARPAARDWQDADTPPKARWYRDEELNTKLRLAPVRDQPPRAAGKTRLLHQVTRLTDIGQAGIDPNQEQLRPLVAQNKTFVRYEVRVNQPAYEFIRDHLGKKSTGRLEFPPGSIHVKAAWMELPPNEEVRRRFYRINATVVIDWAPGDPPTPVTAERILGLVGLHIVHKTPQRRDWIWSTFEHVDNLLDELEAGAPCASYGGISPASPHYPGKNQPRPAYYRAGESFPKEPTPVEVWRDAPIPDTTREVNRRFREEHPQLKDTVWRNYKLVGTQWPVKGARTLGNPEARLPGRLANMTMETYNQGISCMGCHSLATASEFVFYPQSKRFDPEE